MSTEKILCDLCQRAEATMLVIASTNWVVHYQARICTNCQIQPLERCRSEMTKNWATTIEWSPLTTPGYLANAAYTGGLPQLGFDPIDVYAGAHRGAEGEGFVGRGAHRIALLAVILAAATQGPKAAERTLQAMGYTYCGGEQWKPSLGKAPDYNLIDELRSRVDKAEIDAAKLRKALGDLIDGYDEGRNREPWSVAKQLWLSGRRAMFIDDPARCAVCGWPLLGSGCRRGDCSFRPVPEYLYSPERAKAEKP